MLGLFLWARTKEQAWMLWQNIQYRRPKAPCPSEHLPEPRRHSKLPAFFPLHSSLGHLLHDRHFHEPGEGLLIRMVGILESESDGCGI